MRQAFGAAVKPLLETLSSQAECWVQVLVPPFLIQLPDNVDLEKQQLIATGPWAPVTNMRHLDGVLGSCLWPDPALAIIAI